MYYILYEGLKIESNEPVYCTVYNYTSVEMYRIVDKLILLLLYMYICVYKRVMII